MKYNAQVRRGIKRECRAAVTEHLGRCIGIGFLYLLPFMLLYVILYVPVFTRVNILLSAGGAAGMNHYRLANLLAQTSNTSWMVLLLTIVVAGPLTCGMMWFYIALRRGQTPPVSVLFRPFTSLHALWSAIKMELCLMLRAFLWMIGPVLAYFLVTMSAVFRFVFVDGTAYAGVLVTVVMSSVVFYLAAWLIGVKLMTYDAGWVLLNDNAEYGAWDATREASAAFKGHFGKLLVFLLSFCGWYVLLFALVYGSCLLGALGLYWIGGGLGIAVMIASLIAAFCINTVLGAFVSAYSRTSFIGLYEFFAAEQGTDTAAGPGSFCPPAEDGHNGVDH